MDLDCRQTSKNNHSNPMQSMNSPPIYPASGLGKMSSIYIDPFATYVDVSSLTG